MDAFETLDQAHEELVALLKWVEGRLTQVNEPMRPAIRKYVAEQLRLRMDKPIARGTEAKALYRQEIARGRGEGFSRDSRFPAPSSVLYARTADISAAQHADVPPGECAVCGLKVTGQQIGGARKHHKTSVHCRNCGAQVAI